MRLFSLSLVLYALSNEQRRLTMVLTVLFGGFR